MKAAQGNRWYRALRTPNDEYFSLMWHLDAIGPEAAWDLSVGTSAQRVGVIDTGIVHAHFELSGKDVAGYDFVSYVESSNDGDGRDAHHNDPGDGFGGIPSSFHGTHVSGTILASTNNGSGIAGINWQAGLITARSLGAGDRAEHRHVLVAAGHLHGDAARRRRHLPRAIPRPDPHLRRDSHAPC